MTEPGDDIVAERDGREIRVEAKGEGSEKPHTSRYGKRFSKPQVKNHVAVALYRAARMRSSDVRSGVAFPNNADHREMVGPIQAALDDLGIIVFWTNTDGTVVQTLPKGACDL